MKSDLILVVDDDLNLRKTLSDILKAKGYNCITAGSGAEGLALMKASPADIALIDLRLPDMTGIEVLRKLKDAYPEVEAIVFTGNASLESAIEATNKGAFSFLQKPYEIEQLLLNIRHASEKKQASDDIRKTQNTLQKILNILPYGIFIIGLDKRIRYANKAAVEMSGYDSEDDIRGMQCNDAMCPVRKDRCPVLDFGQHLEQSERALVTRQGKHLPVLKTVIPVEIDGEDLLLEAVVDITERKKVEHELDMAHATLFHASRLSQLGEMATGIAHEINQPLNIIGIASQTVLADAEDSMLPPLHPNVEETFHLINKQVSRINGIIEHLRTFARKDNNGNSHVKTDVTDAVKGSLSLISAQLRLRDIRIETDFQEDLSPVAANTNRLEQVFLNLITNARDALELRPKDTEKVLHIRTYHAEDGCVIAEFTDNGGGIPPQIQKNIFDPFFTTKEVGKGTGLGLSISFGIIEEHSGRIDLEVTEGVGSTFRVILPVMASAEVSNV